MKTPRRHRLLTALALGALLATGFSVSAEPAGQDNRREVRKDKREQRQEQRKDRREDRKEHRQERREDRVDRREDRREVRQDRREDRREVRQDRREDRQQVRAQIARQQQYQRIRAAQARQAAAQRRAYNRHYGYPPAYRYSYGGRWHSTSHYGANMLRSAVQRGYQEGLRAGRSDRHDRWGHDYRRSRVWIDASFGYGGAYVSRSDYAHYFRQGFERGYEDGYYGRGRYGRYVNGEAVIIQAVLEAILGFDRLG